MNRKFFARSVIVASLCAAFVGSYVYLENSGIEAAHAAPAPAALLPVAQETAMPATSLPAISGRGTDFSSIVERYGPAVVNISVVGKTQKVSQQEMPGVDPNDPFFQFFRRFGGQPMIPRGQDGGGNVMHGEGSGFIVSPNGIILTNAHVVDGAQDVTVKLTDRREFKAKVLGADKQSDVAVIKIDAKDLPTVVIGNPNLTKVGEPVLAIGSPFGFENTATAGIVSAKARTLPDDPYVSFMQTDVAVNPGNSGGPLFNLRGEVIGINSQIYSRTGGYEGLSFAIPIDLANKVQAQLVAHGKVTRGHLGVTIQEINQALAESFGLKKPAGALVSSVEKGSPAEKAGIEPGDVIVSIGDHPVDHSAELSALVSDLPPGTSSKVEVIRHGTSKTLSVSIGEVKRPELAQNEEGDASRGKLGVLTRPLDHQEQAESGLANGLVVEQAGGPAARAGIRPGDVILSLNGNPVSSTKQFQSLLQQAGKNVALLIQRDDAKIFVPIDLG